MRYVTCKQFHLDTMKLFQILNEKYPDLAGVAGIPRSGLMVASQIAVMSGVPLYEATAENGIREVGSGFRMELPPKPEGTIVVIDDSSNTGRSLKEVQDVLGDDYQYAVVYATEKMADKIDAYAVLVDDTHFFQWHLFGSLLLTRYQNIFGEGVMIDFDGVLCEDCPVEDDDDGERYLNFLKNTKPLVMARPYSIHSIATARLSKYREQTKEWLAKYNIRWRNLYMGQWETLEERRENYDAGLFKGNIYLKSGCALFVESCPVQARQIFNYTKRPVICSSTGEALHTNIVGTERLRTHLAQ